MKFRARIRLLAALVAAACSSDPTGGGEILVVSQIDVQPPGATVVVGGTQQLSATPKTSSGITVPNRTVAWSSEDQGIATVSTAGLVTGVSVGSAVITARVDEITRDVTINVTPKPVASVSVEPPQVSISVGGSQQLTATPRDAQGQALQDRPVTFTSDNLDVATVSATGLVTGVAAGATTIRATVEGRTGTSSITVTPRPPTRLAFTTQPADGTAGQALGPIRVTVQDEVGGTVSAATTGITLSIADNPGGATLGGTLTVNAVAGVATFTTVMLDKAAAGYTLRASAVALSPANSSPFTIAPGPAARLVMVTQPSATTTSGAPLAVQPVVRIIDANGNAVSQGGTPVTVQVVEAGATLAGNLTVQTAANGTATFTTLSLSGTSGNYSLRFIAAGLVEVVSSLIALSPGVPSGLLLQTPPSGTAQSGIPFAQQPAVRLRDESNNSVALAGVPITVDILTGSPALSGTLSALTDASGLATFTDLRITGVVGNRTLVFASPGLGSAASGTITITAGPGHSIAANSAVSQSATVATAVATPPSVLVTDASGNPVSGVNVTFTVTAGGGTITPASPATIATGVDGVATLTNWTLGTTAGADNNSLTAAAAVPNGAPVTFTATALAGPANSIVASSATSQSATANTAVSDPPSVLVTDALGNPKSGVDVTFTITAGGGTTSPASPATISTGVDGVATVSSWTLGSAVGTDNNAITASAAVPNGSPVTFTASGEVGTASTISANSTTSQSATVNTAVAAPPSVKITDAGGNPVPGVSVTFTLTGGGGSIDPASPATIATDAGGIATLGAWTLGTTAGVDNNTVSATAAVPNGSPVVFTATATAGAASTITANSAVTQSAPAGSDVTPPSVLVTDQFGNPVAGVDVTFALTANGTDGSISNPGVVTTGANGVASQSTWTLGNDVGTDNIVEASASVPNGSPVVFTATATAESGNRAARTLSQLLLRL